MGAVFCTIKVSVSLCYVAVLECGRGANFPFSINPEIRTLNKSE